MPRTLLLVVFALGMLAGSAFAKPKVALAVDGEDADEILNAIIDALDDSELVVISPKAVSRAIDDLGYEDDDLSTKQAGKLGKKLEVEAVVLASSERAGKHKLLRFRLVVGGKKVRGFRVTFNNAESRNFKTKLRAKLEERIGSEVEALVADRASEEDDDEGDRDDDDRGRRSKRKKKRLARGDDDEGRDDDDRDERHRGRDRDDEDDDDELDDSDEAAIEASVRRVSPHAANRVAIRVESGVSFQNRRLVFTQRGNFPEGPKPFNVSPVPGARFEAELYPFAFSNPKSVLGGLGFAAEYDQTLSLTLRTSAEPDVPVAATQRHWSVGARLRIPFGGTPTSPSITLGAGIARRRFEADRSGLMAARSLDVPDTYYQMIDPGVQIRIPLAEVIALTFGGEALLIYDAGAIQKPTSYGQAKVFGASAQAGLDIVLANRFAIRLVGEVTQVGFSFTGKGELSVNRDGDPTTKDIGGATDRAIGGAATIGVLY